MCFHAHDRRGHVYTPPPPAWPLIEQSEISPRESCFLPNDFGTAVWTGRLASSVLGFSIIGPKTNGRNLSIFGYVRRVTWKRASDYFFPGDVRSVRINTGPLVSGRHFGRYD